MYAAGKIPGGFIKRESRPSEARHPGCATDRPAHPAAVPRGLQGRRPDRPDRALDGPGERPRHPRHDRRVGRADDQRDPLPGPRGAVRIGRIDGQFVVNPTTSQLQESELDLVVSGTRDAIMMVEAGCQHPARVRDGRRHHVRPPLAGAAHRPPGGAPGSRRQGQAHAVRRARHRTPSSSSSRPSEAGASFVVFDIETTSRDAKSGELVEIGAVRVRGRAIVDRWSTLVKPGARHRRASSSTASPRRTWPRRPAPRRLPASCFDWAGDDMLVGHNVGFDIAFVEAALGDGTRIAPGRYLDTLTLAREAYPDLDAYKLADWSASSRSAEAEPPRPPGRGGHRQRAAAPGRGPARCACARSSEAGRASIRSCARGRRQGRG